MTTRNPLFEFMPYGAPELLAAQRPNLLRALALASALAVASFAVAKLLGLSAPIQPIEVAFVLGEPHAVLDNPPSVIPSRPTGLPAVIPAPPQGPAYVMPVDDAVVLPAEIPTGDPSRSADAGIGDAPNPPAAPGSVAPSEDTPPARGDWVYTDEMPVAVKLVKPVYPELPREMGIEGPVYVHMLVGKNGRVMRAEVDEKIQVPTLNDAALTAARQWVFKPAFAQGHPIMVWVGEKFVFTLH